MKTNLELIEELEKNGFECEGGPLEKTIQFIELKERGKQGERAPMEAIEIAEIKLNFSQVLNALKEGKKVAREYWVNNGVFIKLEDIGMTNKEIVMYRREEKFILNLSNDSIMAEDWKIID